MRKIEVSQETFDYIHTVSNLLNIPVNRFTETIFSLYKQKNSETILKLSNEVELAKQRVLDELGAESIETKATPKTDKISSEISSEISLTSPLDTLSDNGELPVVIVSRLYGANIKTVEDFLKTPAHKIRSLSDIGNKRLAIAIDTQNKYKLLFDMKGDQNNVK